MVNFQNWKGELDIYPQDSTMGEDEPEAFNLAYTAAGFTLRMNPEFELV